MAIEFNQSSTNPINRSDSKSSSNSLQRNEQSRSGRADSVARDDSVEISRDADAVDRLAQRLERQESFDQARVERIKQAIQQGEYPVDNERLASKFLELENQINQ